MPTRTLAACLLALAVAAPALAGGDWNDSGIAWQPYEQGLAQAKKDGKPVCLIFFTEWCPHCTNYSKVFHDPKVVAESKKFVMIRLDKDKNGEVSKQYALDGEYIPRTYFLSPSGQVETGIHASRDKFLYFYDEHDPAPLLSSMAEAEQKLAGKKS
jgi:thiol-disulfide isomerase/thioredoxin